MENGSSLSFVGTMVPAGPPSFRAAALSSATVRPCQRRQFSGKLHPSRDAIRRIPADRQRLVAVLDHPDPANIHSFDAGTLNPMDFEKKRLAE